MRITVEIDDASLDRIRQATGIERKSPAVARALRDYLATLDRRTFIQRVCEGKTDYPLTNEELEARDTHDPD